MNKKQMTRQLQTGNDLKKILHVKMIQETSSTFELNDCLFTVPLAVRVLCKRVLL